MKASRAIWYIICAAVFLTLCVHTAEAGSLSNRFLDGNYQCVFLDEESVKITKVFPFISEEEFAFADRIEGKKVVEIGSNAFNYDSWDQEDTYADAHTYILPETLRILQDEAFRDPNEGEFGNERLERINIPDSLEIITGNPFVDCRELKEVIISENHPLFEMKEGVLFNKPEGKLIASLPKLTDTFYAVPEMAKAIGKKAFSGCKNLQKIVIHQNVEEIGDNPFQKCDPGLEIFVDSGNERFEIKDGVLFDTKEKRLITALGKEKYEVPAGTKIIGNHAFYHCKELSEIIIPEGVTAIGDGAFEGCINLSSITLPDSLISIGNLAFTECINLSSVTLPNNLISIGDSAFSGCEKLQEIHLPDGIRSIGNRVFDYCENLRSLNIPYGVETITAETIDGVEIILPPDHPTLEIRENSLISKADQKLIAYLGKGETGPYKIPEGIRIIGPYAFSGCTADVVFPESLIMIEEGAFEYCTGMESVVLPEGTVFIGDKAFLGASLKDIYLPDTIEYVGNYAFEHSDLQKISVPNKGFYLGDMCFFCLANNIGTLKIFDVRDAGKNTEETQDGQDGEKYFSGPFEPIIGYKAFWRTGIETMTIPNGIMEIKKEAFEGSEITEVTIPESVSIIGAEAFSDCYKLAGITIPESVTAIGNRTFSNCYMLAGITIPESVTAIGDRAFSDCWNLEKIAIHQNVEEIVDNPFQRCNSELEIAVDSGNERFEVKDGVLFDKKEKRLITALGKEKYEVPEGTKIIGDYAFYECSELSEINIPEGVTAIGAEAFYDCYRLTEITIPESVTDIGAEAFAYCGSLTAVIVRGSYAEKYCIENGVPFVYQDEGN